MGIHRDFNHLDRFYASWSDALQEFIGNAVLGLRLTALDATTIRVAADSGSGMVAVGVAGRWRYRKSNYDRIVSGSAGVKDIYIVAVTENDFTGVLPIPQDPDATDYNFEVRIVTTATTPTGVVAYRKVGEVDWDGAKITGLRQTVGAADQTLPSYPTAPRPDAPAEVVRGATAQTANLSEWRTAAGALLFAIEASGKLKPASRPDYTLVGTSADRTIDVSTVTGFEVVNVLSTLITDLMSQGLAQ